MEEKIVAYATPRPREIPPDGYYWGIDDYKWVLYPNPEVTTPREIGVTPIYDKNRESGAKTIVNVGGAGSSKSHSLEQLFIERLTQEKNKRIGITRKTFNSLRMTTMLDMVALLKDYGIYDPNHHNKSEHIYTHNSSSIQFFGLDEAEKLKSANFNYIWMEEANEFTYKDYTILKLRCRHPTIEGERNQMFLSLNPSDANGWIPKRLLSESDVEMIHSTFEDNPFLSQDYIQTIKDLIHQDANFYKIYALGEWGLLQRRIYINYKVIPELPDMSEAKWCYGLDFGLVNPSAIVKVYLLSGQFYLEERLYKSGITNKDIIEHLTHEEKGDIYADPSAKQMIEEIFRAGYNAYEAHKDVKDGIDLCQRQTLLVPASSVHLIEEIQSYQWKEAKDGNIMSEPVKFNDHLMDAMRYAVYGMTERYGFATAKPGGDKPQSMRPSFSFG